MAEASTSADQVFSALRGSTYQIRIIEEKSGSQAALGTGFLVASNRLATNYHVVSNDVLEPDKYRIEIEVNNNTYPLDVLAVDVVHDLAILQLNEARFEQVFTLSSGSPRNGEVLYSLGNPHNLGLTIVEGNYNGLVENKFIDQIHFSGAINSGMSGGPAVNGRFEVVGVNVATGGNQLGFLVPVKYLSLLLKKSNQLPKDYELLTDMSRQIADSTTAMIEDLVSREWPKVVMGSAWVPSKTVAWLTCWGNSKDDTEKGILNISRGCNNGDNVFINRHFSTGFLEYEYAYFEAEKWPSAAFYRYLKGATSDARAGNQASKDDVDNYHCVDEILKPLVSLAPTQSSTWSPMSRRVSYCTRAYKKFPDLYDVFYIGVSQDESNKSVLEHFTIAGVSKESSLMFLKKFMAVLAWES